VVERFAQLDQLHGFLIEEKDLAAKAGSKLRGAILAGFDSAHIMAAMRTMAFICDAWMWLTLVAVKADGGEHILDVLPAVWTESLRWLRSAADEPAAVINGSTQLDALLGAAGQRTMVRDSEGTATRGGRAAMAMNRIRATVEANRPGPAQARVQDADGRPQRDGQSARGPRVRVHRRRRVLGGQGHARAAQEARRRADDEHALRGLLRRVEAARRGGGRRAARLAHGRGNGQARPHYHMGAGPVGCQRRSAISSGRARASACARGRPR